LSLSGSEQFGFLSGGCHAVLRSGSRGNHKPERPRGAMAILERRSRDFTARSEDPATSYGGARVERVGVTRGGLALDTNCHSLCRLIWVLYRKTRKLCLISNSNEDWTR
jgi:hypothetical protein